MFLKVVKAWAKKSVGFLISLSKRENFGSSYQIWSFCDLDSLHVLVRKQNNENNTNIFIMYPNYYDFNNLTFIL